MSGERDRTLIPRPVATSHHRPIGEPFMKASDFVDEVTPQPVWTLEKLGRVMIEGFNATNARIDEHKTATTTSLDALVVRIAKVETDAQWKTRLLWAFHKGWPFALAVLAHYAPDLAKLLSGVSLPGVAP